MDQAFYHLKQSEAAASYVLKTIFFFKPHCSKNTPTFTVLFIIGQEAQAIQDGLMAEGEHTTGSICTKDYS